MLKNNSLTIYHKGFDYTSRIETWTRFNYDNVWIFSSKGSNENKGYNDINNIEVRIPYTNDLNIDNFSIGDIIVEGTITTNINSQQDLKCDIYNITNIKNNNFGNNKHIHLGGK